MTMGAIFGCRGCYLKISTGHSFGFACGREKSKQDLLLKNGIGEWSTNNRFVSYPIWIKTLFFVFKSICLHVAIAYIITIIIFTVLLASARESA